jgi:hypothetical protein
MAVPAFEPVLCGETIAGDGWTDGAGTRDTDWYQFVVVGSQDVDLSFVAQRTAWVGGIVNTGGTGNCADATAISPVASLVGCGNTFGVSATLDDSLGGIYWFFSAPQFGSAVVIDCGDKNVYEMTVSGEECVPSPDGDTNGDGFTDFTDLLNVLANWGPCPGGTPGCTGDVDCNGQVEFTDLLTVLANWNPPS